MRRARTRRHRAFTLFEALISVAMIVLLAGALALFVDDLGTTRGHVMRNVDRTRSADALFSLVETALQTAVVDGGAMGAGIAGGPSNLRVLSSRTDATGATPADLARAAFAPLVVTQVTQQGSSVMVGRAGASAVLPAPIGRVRFQYFDGTEWSDECDSLVSGRLPVMVEVAMWFGAAEQEEAETGEEPQAVASATVAEEQLTAMELPPPDRVRRFAIPDALPSDGAEVAP